MKKITTRDNSETFFNEELNESYHSMSGAVEESFEKFARPSKIIEKAKQNKEINVLDICFGLGYNSAAAIDLASGANEDVKINIVGLEKDINIIKKAKEVKNSFKSYHIIRRLADNISRNNFNVKYENISIRLVLGNAIETIKGLSCCFDAVFLDAFSPKKQPELWQDSFIKDISKVMKKGAVLTTYSCAKIVRKNLENSGFIVKDGPRIGRKSPSTIAVKQ